MPPSTSALLLLVALVLFYLLLTRLVDLNEREPLWSLLLFIGLGALAAPLMRLLVAAPNLELTLWKRALAEETATLAAFLAGSAILWWIARWRGWFEMHGALDGALYGSAAGLGFAAGDALLRSLSAPPLVTALSSPWTTFWSSALFGLAHALFGGALGGIAAAGIRARRAGPLLARATLGLAAAIALNVGYQWLAFGNALGGADARLRLWVALLAPLAWMGALLANELVRERRALREELSDELGRGILSTGEQADLDRPLARISRTAALTAGGRWTEARERAAVQNQLVRLALTKRAARIESDAERRELLLAEVERLRVSVLALRGGVAPREERGS